MALDDGSKQAPPPPPPPTETPPRPTRIAPKRGWAHRFFRENVGIKIVSLVLAIVLLIVVRQDQGREVDIEIPVVLSDKNDNDVFVGDMPKVLRVRVKDRWSRVVRALERKSTPYLVDLRGFSNESIFVFDRERIQVLLGLSGLSIQSVYPSQVAVKTEPKAEVIVAVRPNLVGEVQEGYMVARDKVRAAPSEIRVWGARSSVQQISELTTHPIDLAPLDKAARIEVLIQKPALPFVFIDQERVQVEVPVSEIEGRVSLGLRELVIRNCPDHLICEAGPPSVRLTLQGAMPTLLRLDRGELPVEIFIDAADFELVTGRHVGVRPVCDRPQGVECILAPRTVTLTMTRNAPEDEEGRKPVPRAR